MNAKFLRNLISSVKAGAQHFAHGFLGAFLGGLCGLLGVGLLDNREIATVEDHLLEHRLRNDRPLQQHGSVQLPKAVYDRVLLKQFGDLLVREFVGPNQHPDQGGNGSLRVIRHQVASDLTVFVSKRWRRPAFQITSGANNESPTVPQDCSVQISPSFLSSQVELIAAEGQLDTSLIRHLHRTQTVGGRAKDDLWAVHHHHVAASQGPEQDFALPAMKQEMRTLLSPVGDLRLRAVARAVHGPGHAGIELFAEGRFSVDPIQPDHGAAFSHTRFPGGGV